MRLYFVREAFHSNHQSSEIKFFFAGCLLFCEQAANKKHSFFEHSRWNVRVYFKNFSYQFCKTHMCSENVMTQFMSKWSSMKTLLYAIREVWHGFLPSLLIEHSIDISSLTLIAMCSRACRLYMYFLGVEFNDVFQNRMIFHEFAYVPKKWVIFRFSM